MGSMAEDTKQVFVEAQERTFVIYKDYICCANCAKNLDIEQRHRGRVIKNHCNAFKEFELKKEFHPIDPNDPNYSIEEDRNRAQSCRYFLPEGMNIAADLTYIAPSFPSDVNVELEKHHANRLKELFDKGSISK